jgi:hypothetical protein
VAEANWQEWVIAICVAALSLLGVWTVFGDDLMQLFQPPQAGQTTPQATPQTTPQATVDKR